jgi:diguanylate cyclase (GGDEF)-like protein
MKMAFQGSDLGNMTISAGVATFPRHAHDRMALLRLADEALYQAKQQGRNRVVEATDHLAAPVQT